MLQRSSLLELAPIWLSIQIQQSVCRSLRVKRCHHCSARRPPGPRYRGILYRRSVAFHRLNVVQNQVTITLVRLSHIFHLLTFQPADARQKDGLPEKSNSAAKYSSF
ncbi:hypothetical protein BDZ89DRAFT_712433 [Hymenopellis radicata]|nr:hypothetical protein BDZ89DRAFT_712433 [Hymenopellis radicata]